ncbi:beta-alanine-activating enzyme-like [Strongylocentrotus purpuratus]|uniref:Carrier domain-containing protein n=1 Tax=Strongylocentrotus purpuratus TaxID=7668 RepID=A0A7M7NG43_STRPU|nr:beta-alanine-activating enzyme-like [Strongylocentrotus purpuratus]
MTMSLTLIRSTTTRIERCQQNDRTNPSQADDRSLLQVPHHLAAIFDDGCHGAEVVTYRQVLETANTVTSLLNAHSKCGEIIGLYAEPGITLPAFILGILQLPAAYGPIDPHAPSSINEYFIKEVGIRIVCVQSCLLEHFANGLGQSFDWELCHHVDQELMSSELVPVRLDATKHNKQDLCNGDREEQSSSLAYALHTSGTTGRPKIVRVPHSCIVPNILDLRVIFTITEDDVVFMASPLTFDPSVVEMFMTWSQGATLLMVPAKLKMAPSSLAQVLKRNHVTVLQATPSLVSRFSSSALQQDLLGASSTLRLLVFGGESCPTPATIARWRGAGNRTEFINLYGITEVSSWASCFQIPEEWIEKRRDHHIPLGDALKDTILQVRDETGRELESGIGEVFIGGYLRVCFLGDEELQVLVRRDQLVMRSTGDMVEVTNRGLLFLGRQDDQVKRHGKRMSLFHVKQVIEACPDVESCDVIHTDGRLIAFYTPSSKHPTSTPAPVEQSGQENDIIQKTFSPLGSASPPLPSPSSSSPVMPSFDLELSDTSAGVARPTGKQSVSSITSLNKLKYDPSSQSDWSSLVFNHKQSSNISEIDLGDCSLDLELSDTSAGVTGPTTGKQLVSSMTLLAELRYNPSTQSADGSSLVFNHKPSSNISEIDPGDCQNNDRVSVAIRALVPSEDSKNSLGSVLQPPRSVAKYLRGALPSHAIPDRFVALQELPITRHGKVDTAALKELLWQLEASEKERREKQNIRGQRSTGRWQEILVREWKNCLFLAESDAIGDHDFFVTLGGDSFQALRLVNSLEASLGMPLPDLMDDLLHRTFSKVQQTIGQHLQQTTCGQSDLENHQDIDTRNQKTSIDSEHFIENHHQEYESDKEEQFANKNVDKLFAASTGKEAVPDNGLLDNKPTQIAVRSVENQDLNISFSEHQKDNFLGVDSATRGRKMDDDLLTSQALKRKLSSRDPLDDASSKKTSISLETAPPLSSQSSNSRAAIQNNCTVSVRRGTQILHHNCFQERTSEGGHGACAEPSVEQSECSVNTGKLCLKEHWKVDTGKCVDASPLVVCTSSSQTVYIGSHSHRFFAITMETGNVLWEAVLGDRVESSACLSACGKYVIVGCYDHFVYCLSASSGDICWKYETGDVVKCSPVCDVTNGLVYVGSHDQHVMALQVQEEKFEMKWRSHCGGGSVFASPCIHHATGTVVAATLRGSVVAFNKESGEMKWSFACPKPVFSSPVAIDNSVLVGCVDGIMYCLSHAGIQLWTHTVDGPIFSSPCISTLHPLSQPLSNDEQPSRHTVVFGSHNGSVTCLDPSTGQLEWTSKVSTFPIYSTPFGFTRNGHRRVAVASTDGHVCILDMQTGNVLTEMVLPGEVFSSPVVIEGKRVIVGCRNDYVYCLHLKETD